MKSKLQKKQEIEQGNALATDAQSLVFVDFSKTPVKQVTQLKNSARALGATYRVVKKRINFVLSIINPA
ncbi:MAG: 50S ribosomal protein L10 [Patescibacteria group bacterium]|nr:50S ribosomal protein L10 [Patescibacteria group bacterium]